jgi:hypothetical protein
VLNGLVLGVSRPFPPLLIYGAGWADDESGCSSLHVPTGRSRAFYPLVKNVLRCVLTLPHTTSVYPTSIFCHL